MKLSDALDCLLKDLYYLNVEFLCINIGHVLILQMIMLEGAKATTETVDALRTRATAIKAMQKAMYVVSFILLLCHILHI